jgi:hypothetical protein
MFRIKLSNGRVYSLTTGWIGDVCLYETQLNTTPAVHRELFEFELEEAAEELEDYYFNFH